MEMPAPAPSMRLPVIVASRKANSAQIAVSFTSAQTLSAKVMLRQEALRKAAQATSRTSLREAVTPSASQSETPLPFSPVPPERVSILRMRLSETREPS